MGRDTDRSHLHPMFRALWDDIETKCHAAGIPIQLYEGARSPFRQGELYARGRTTGERGKHATNAHAWDSFHQYGLAVDGVFKLPNGTWTWAEPEHGMWDKYTEIARVCGGRTLSFERPHVELPVSIGDLRAGRYPVDGDDSWQEWLETQIETWGSGSRIVSDITHPGAPPHPSIWHRPELEVA